MSVFTTMFASNALVTTMYMTVILPQEKHVRCGSSPEYHLQSFQKEYPLLLLLHDEASSQRELLYKTNLERYATEAGVAVVIPDGMHGFYRDHYWRDDETKQSDGKLSNKNIESGFSDMRFEQMLIDEVLPLTQNQFLPLSFSAGRSHIAGIGMGGFGAVRLAARYPDLFSRIYSVNGYLDISWLKENCPDRKEQLFAVFGNEIGPDNDCAAQAQLLTNRNDSSHFLTQYWCERDWTAPMNETFSAALSHCCCYRKKVSHDEKQWDYIDRLLKEILFDVGAEYRKSNE